MVEALAVVMMLRDVPAEVRGRAGLFFVDNLAALCGLVRGYSAIADLGAIYLAVAQIILCLSASAWLGWVPSASNLADGCSRTGVTHALTAACWVDMLHGEWQRAFPSFSSFEPNSWHAWWPAECS